MTFNYEVQTSPSCYSEELDEEFYDTETISYEPDYKELENAVVDVIFNNYFKKTVIDKQTFKKELKRFISDLDIENLEEYFEDDLREYFEDEAMENYRESYRNGNYF